MISFVSFQAEASDCSINYKMNVLGISVLLSFCIYLVHVCVRVHERVGVKGDDNRWGQSSPFMGCVLRMGLRLSKLVVGALSSNMSPQAQIFLKFLLSQHCVLRVAPGTTISA